MKVTTGYGYFMKDGKITDKCKLPIGDHKLEGYEYIEVADQAALDAIEIYVEPIAPEVLEAQEMESLIEQKKRELAIEALKVEGKLDVDAKLTVSGKAALSLGEVK